MPSGTAVSASRFVPCGTGGSASRAVAGGTTGRTTAVTVPNGGRSTMTSSSWTGNGPRSCSSSRSVRYADAMPPLSWTRARAGRPSVSRSRMVSASAAAGSPGRPWASGLPCGFSAQSITAG